MDHFSVVQSLIRAGLAGDRSAFEKQVARLRARLEKAGDVNDADTIDRLLRAASETRELQPSRVEVSRALVRGERLTPETHPPIDRETGAQLCTIDFAVGDPPVPVYEERVKETIDGLLQEWTNAAALEGVGVEPTRSLLIFGPPGSGKTLTARYIASHLSLPLIIARIDGLISSFLGTTARNIAHLFDFANRYACILLLDEFDALAKLRDDPQEIGEIKRVVNTLLQNLDHRRDYGVTIAITNHDRLLDPAVWRRFETHVHIGEPDRGAREALIARFLEPIETSPEIVQLFAYCLDGRSGADLERICTSVKRTLALSRDAQDSPGLFRALSAVVARLPAHDNEPARLLAVDPEAFLTHVTNDPSFRMTQKALGQATGYGQSKISEIKNLRRFPPLGEPVNA